MIILFLLNLHGAMILVDWGLWYCRGIEKGVRKKPGNIDEVGRCTYCAGPQTVIKISPEVECCLKQFFSRNGENIFSPHTWRVLCILALKVCSSVANVNNDEWEEELHGIKYIIFKHRFVMSRTYTLLVCRRSRTMLNWMLASGRSF